MAQGRQVDEQRPASAVEIGLVKAKCLPTVNVSLALLFLIAWCAGGELAGASQPAGNLSLVLDRSECKITFSLPAVLHTVRGTFWIRDGNLRLDAVSGKMTGKVVVDVTSGNTGEEERDRRMHQEVLESNRFPEAVFSADRLVGHLAFSGESKLVVHGVLRIHGRDHEVALPATVNLRNGRFTAVSRLQIPYVKWGMRDPSTLILRVSKEVVVELRIRGTVRQE